MATRAPVSGPTETILRRVFSFIAHPLGIAVVVAGVVLALIAADLMRAAAKAASLTKQLQASEAARLEAEGIVVSERATQKALLDEADRLQAEIGILTQQLGQKPKIREVTKWKTGEVVVWPGMPSDPAAPCADDASPKGFDCPPVKVSVAGVSASLETNEGNVVVTGNVDIVRESPPPREVFQVPYEVTSSFVAKPEPVAPRWFLGPAAAMQDGKAAFGVAAVGPRVRLWKVEARPVFQVVSDSGGSLTASAAFVIGIGR
jgi:hypothetical protein